MPDPLVTGALIEGGLGIAGGLLGGGGGRKPTYGFGFQDTVSSGATGSSESTATDSRTEVFPDTVWNVQSPYLSNIYKQASDLFSQGGASQAQAQGFINQGQGALSTLMNPGTNPLMEVYQQQLQQGLTDYILPSIRREAAGAGMVGGTRHGTAEGLALQEAQRQQSQFAATLYNQDMDRMLSAAQSTPALAEAGLGVPWYGLNQYASAVGSPTILGQGSLSTTTSRGSASSFGHDSSTTRREDAQGTRGFIESTFPTRFKQDKPSSSGGRNNTFGNQR